MNEQMNTWPHWLPCDLQTEFNGPQVVDVHGDRLRESSIQVLGLARHGPYDHVIGQALQLRYLGDKQHAGRWVNYESWFGFSSETLDIFVFCMQENVYRFF